MNQVAAGGRPATKAKHENAEKGKFPAFQLGGPGLTSHSKDLKAASGRMRGFVTSRLQHRFIMART